jgi:ATP-dependent DNA helicase 2 subunit 2
LNDFNACTNRVRSPWHDPSLCYNPAVHRVKQALFHAAIVPDLLTHPVPPPHQELTRYLEPPSKMMKRANHSIEECRKVFNVIKVQKKPMRKVERHVEAIGDDDLLLAPITKVSRSDSKTAVDEHLPVEDETEVPVEDISLAGMQNEDMSDDEISPDIDISVDRADEAIEYDRGIAEGRIIGNNFPLEDFEANLKSGDVVSKAVEDFAAVIQEIAIKPLATKRHDELITCLERLREACLTEDEIEAWNEYAFRHFTRTLADALH